jgi:hypothetical protein
MKDPRNLAARGSSKLVLEDKDKGRLKDKLKDKEKYDTPLLNQQPLILSLRSSPRGDTPRILMRIPIAISGV